MNDEMIRRSFFDEIDSTPTASFRVALRESLLDSWNESPIRTVNDAPSEAGGTGQRPGRRVLLLAACAALVAAGVVALVALQADEAQPPAPSQTVPPPTSQTAPPTQPRVTPTTVSSSGDSEIAGSLLLSGEEYGSDWVVVPNGAVYPTTSSAIASGLPACAAFVDSVFGALERGASDFHTFFYAEPEALMTQYVAVLPDAEAAQAVYELINSAGFAPCVSAYGSVLDGGQAPSVFPSPVDQPIADPPFEPIGDALTFRTFPASWYDVMGGAHGPRTYVDAVILVGRTITFVGTATEAEGGAIPNTIEQFGAALQRVVERAGAALA
ncbi:MAG TPA: hypothetical protein VF065_03090 [Ilumatobacter sp.]